MEYIKFEDLDKNKTFFHFTRIANRNSIEKNGLQAVAAGENKAANDKDNKTIYFSMGVEGVLKTLDVWVRWEYDHIDNSEEFGYKGINKGKMNKTYQKMYNDFKKRQYYTLDLEEGKDFKFGDVDKKKEFFCRNGRKPSPIPKWEYGPYSNFESNKQEIWNMNTIIGERKIPSDRIKIIENKYGRSDALSVALEIYDKYRNQFKDIDFCILDGFINYAREMYKKDPDYAKNTPDLGRKDVSKEEAEKYKRINHIKADPKASKKCRISLMKRATKMVKVTLLEKNIRQERDIRM